MGSEGGSTIMAKRNTTNVIRFSVICVASHSITEVHQLGFTVVGDSCFPEAKTASGMMPFSDKIIGSGVGSLMTTTCYKWKRQQTHALTVRF